MIEFASENARHCFHELPIDEQNLYNDLALDYAKKDYVITIVCVYLWSKDQAEISLRIDKKFNVG